MVSMNPFYTSHRIGQLILKRSALSSGCPFFTVNIIRSNAVYALAGKTHHRAGSSDAGSIADGV
ncbi:hypothetical protein EYS10_17750 [Rahnella aquatilis]|nr:hypothetical protein EYS10_17750 [Rahnella aquatilis]